MRDYSIQKYREICSTLINSGYQSMTFTDYFSQGDIDLSAKRVLLRHDVDRLASMSLTMARIEADMGFTASYYFRLPHTYKPSIIEQIAALGHEVGFHYENLSKAKGDLDQAKVGFSHDLIQLRKLAQVKTVAMHGSPASRFDNRDLMKSLDINDFDLLGDAHIDINFEKVLYYSDTGRTWEEGKYNIRDKIPEGMLSIKDKSILKTSDDLIDLIKIENRNLYLVMHPERWPSSRAGWILSWTKDTMLNWGKIVFKTIYALKS